LLDDLAIVFDVIETVFFDLELADLLHGVMNNSRLGRHFVLIVEPAESLLDLSVSLSVAYVGELLVNFLHHFLIPAWLPTRAW